MTPLWRLYLRGQVQHVTVGRRTFAVAFDAQRPPFGAPATLTAIPLTGTLAHWLAEEREKETR